MTDGQKTGLFIGGIGVVALLWYLGNLAIRAKIDPVRLVAAGTEQANNQTSVAIGTQAYRTQAEIAALAAQQNIALMQLQNQIAQTNAQAAQNIELYRGAGGVLSDIVGVIGGKTYGK